MAVFLSSGGRLTPKSNPQGAANFGKATIPYCYFFCKQERYQTMMLSLNTLVILGLIGVVGFLGSKWLFKKDTETEDRRRGAAKLAASLKAYGLVKIPDFLIDYSVGDYSGMAMKMKQLAEMFLAGEPAVVTELDAVYERVLAEKLKTEAGRALVASKLADAKKEADSSVVASAPGPAVR